MSGDAVAKLEAELAAARDALERMRRHAEFHSDEDIAAQRALVRALEDVLARVKGASS
jgi:hypothetical protein